MCQALSWLLQLLWPKSESEKSYFGENSKIFLNCTDFYLEFKDNGVLFNFPGL